MTLSSKILIFLGSFLLIGALFFIIVKQIEITKRQTAIEAQTTQQKELAESIVRAQREWATKKDIDELAKDNGINLSIILSDLEKLGARVDGINSVVVKSIGQKQTDISSTNTVSGGPGPTVVDCKGTSLTCPDPYGYLSKTQELKIDEKFSNASVPFGNVGFSSWKDKPWSLTVYPRSYTLTTVVGKDDEGKEYAYNKLQIAVDGKQHDVKIDQSRFLQEYPNDKFSFFNPRIYLGIGGGVNFQKTNVDFVPSAYVTFMSYGKFKYQPSFTFVGVGAGYAVENKQFNFLLTPFTYNVGQHIPLTKNIHLGPTIGFDTSGGVSGLVTVGVGL